MNATVTMPVSDLDTLRDQVKKYRSEAEELRAKEREVKIITVKRDWHDRYGNGYTGPWRDIAHTSGLYTNDVVYDVKIRNLEDITSMLREEEKKKVEQEYDRLDSDYKQFRVTAKKQVEELEEKILELAGKKVNEDKEKELAELKEKDELQQTTIRNLMDSCEELSNNTYDIQQEFFEYKERNLFRRLFNMPAKKSK